MRGRAWLSAWTSRGSCGPLGRPAAGRSGRWRARATRRAAQGGPGVPAPQSLGAFGQGARCPAESVPVRGLRALARGVRMGASARPLVVARGPVAAGLWVPGVVLGPRPPLVLSRWQLGALRRDHPLWDLDVQDGEPVDRLVPVPVPGAHHPLLVPVPESVAAVEAEHACALHIAARLLHEEGRRDAASRRVPPHREGDPLAGGGAPAPALSGPGLSRPASRHGFPVLAARRTWIHGPGGMDPGAPRLPAVARVVSLGMVIARRCPVGLRVRGPVQRSPPGFGSYGPR